MEHSKVFAPDTKNGTRVFKFQSKLRKEKTRKWLRNYFGLPDNDDLVLSEVKLLSDVDYTFWISVDLSHDRQETIYLTDLLGEDKEVETQEGPIKFFISIRISDTFGEDHLSSNSIFREKVYQSLLQMEKEFLKFSEEHPDPNYF
ncbi:hypothetical protein [Autumnicola musiva]|uniref:Uncharacterized protein n=1 Tax=Autumnicola musiva TaxID=3075589 RepID=A0ABU3D1F6_9FLAO|nr:hypothetical protein [Zunongwangia sp. F117]MDT0675370.1 hypothetical protein [Zunongwangia sp. F117]